MEPNKGHEAERHQELGRALPTFNEQSTKLTIVGRMIIEQEQLSNSYGTSRALDPNPDNPRRCFQIQDAKRTRQSDSSQTAELSLEYVTETDKIESYTLQTLVLHFQETTNEYDLAAPLSSHPRARESIKTDPASHRKIPLYERKLPRRLFCQVRSNGVYTLLTSMYNNDNWILAGALLWIFFADRQYLIARFINVMSTVCCTSMSICGSSFECKLDAYKTMDLALPGHSLSAATEELINEGTTRISIKDDDYKYLASSIS
ncbi:hypothetical protein AB4K20DRAFT_1799694 [Rhizopus microsporus]